MNFSNVRGYDAYAQFTAKVRESVKSQEAPKKRDIESDRARSLFSEPVDTVSISRSARSLSLSFTATQQPQSAQTALKEWMRESGTMSGAMTHRMSGEKMAELLSTNGITFDEDEVYNVNIDVWCAVTVAGKNAEKAKAIQDLLNSTPSGINWGVLLQRLPPD